MMLQSTIQEMLSPTQGGRGHALMVGNLAIPRQVAHVECETLENFKQGKLKFSRSVLCLRRQTELRHSSAIKDKV